MLSFMFLHFSFSRHQIFKADCVLFCNSRPILQDQAIISAPTRHHSSSLPCIKMQREHCIVCESVVFVISFFSSSSFSFSSSSFSSFSSSSSSSQNADEMQVLYYVARILEATIPLMHHPSSEFLTSVEEDLVKLTLKHGQNVNDCSTQHM